MKKVIEAFHPSGGNHCITNALKQLFAYHGHPLSEEMLFGLGEGLDFTYINLAYSPMVSGRSKIMEFEDTLSRNLECKVKIKSGKDYQKIFEITKKLIDADQPVLVYADMPYLPYLSLSENSHFGGHAIVIFGYDDEKEMYYISDRDHSNFPIATPNGNIAEDYHLVSYDQMQKARTSTFRPFPALNKYVSQIDWAANNGKTFTNALFSSESESFHGDNARIEEIIIPAIMGVCSKMLNPPAKLKGIYGIEKFSKELLKWSSFDKDKLKRAGITNYFQISKDGGTGGGIFRKMYGDFLLESSALLNDAAIGEIGLQFIDLSAQWDQVADGMWQLSIHGDAAQLPAISAEIKSLHDTELNLLVKLTNMCERRKVHQAAKAPRP